MGSPSVARSAAGPSLAYLCPQRLQAFPHCSPPRRRSTRVSDPARSQTSRPSNRGCQARSRPSQGRRRLRSWRCFRAARPFFSRLRIPVGEPLAVCHVRPQLCAREGSGIGDAEDCARRVSPELHPCLNTLLRVAHDDGVDLPSKACDGIVLLPRLHL